MEGHGNFLQHRRVGCHEAKGYPERHLVSTSSSTDPIGMLDREPLRCAAFLVGGTSGIDKSTSFLFTGYDSACPVGCGYQCGPQVASGWRRLATGVWFRWQRESPHDTLPSFGYHIVPPHEQQLYHPTSRPRQEGFVGRAIDWVATKHASTSRALICTDSCFHLGTDHDLIAVHLDLLQRQHVSRRVRTGRRSVTTPVRVPSEINQKVLEDLARAHTSPPASNAYVDDATAKRLFVVAKRSKLPGDWKKALKVRKTAHDRWRRERVQKAIAGDWVALKERQQPKGVGWEGKFAEHVAPRDPHDLLHDHFANALSNPDFTSHRSRAPPRSTDITEAELDAAIQAGKPGRSVGIDGICFELLRDLSQDSQAKKHCWHGTTPFCTLGACPNDGRTSSSSSCQRKNLLRNRNMFAALPWEVRRRSSLQGLFLTGPSNIFPSYERGNAVPRIVNPPTLSFVFTDLLR